MISGDFVEIDPKDASLIPGSWTNPDIPARQYEVVEKELNFYRAGLHSPSFTFEAVIHYLRTIHVPRPIHLLDVGAAFGYYREVFQLAQLPVQYRGVDSSNAFVEFGRKQYPDIDLTWGDSRDLHFDDRSFDVVLSSAVIMHTAEYDKAILEVARVAARYVILARTPVSNALTRFYKKTAYDVADCLEIHFSEDDLLATFRKAKLTIKAMTVLSVDVPMRYQMKTYLLEKQ